MGVMGRHVVVSFDNPTDAEEFVKAMTVEGAIFFQGADGHFKNIDPDTTEVGGVFAKPNDFCECPYIKDMNYVRGSKYGLYVHDKCKKPAGGHLQSASTNLHEAPMIQESGAKMHRLHLSVREGITRWPEPKEK